MPAPAPWAIDYDPAAPRVEVVPGTSIPLEFSYTVTPAGSPLTATVHMRVRDGVAVCERVEAARRDSKPLSSTDVKTIPFGQLISEAPAVAASASRPGPIRVGDRARAGEDELERVRRAVARKQGIPVDLADVAKVYRAAQVAGEPPIITISETFGVSERTASRRVADARHAGLLGPALDRRAGEKTTAYRDA
jgi:hypothetical protein